MDTYADDLAELIETLDLRDVTLIGFSTGGGEVTRYVGRHGTGRVAKIVVSAVPPFMLKTDDNPGGVPIDVFDGLRAGSLADRSQLYRDLADGPFFGNNRPGASVSQGTRDAFCGRERGDRLVGVPVARLHPLPPAGRARRRRPGRAVCHAAAPAAGVRMRPGVRSGCG
jgi:pimeloyl-ACP methyl ester carboxylesterase